MVILQFNKFIRNKWAWGAVAVLFCLMFVGADVVSTLTRERTAKAEGAGTLGGEPVDPAEFSSFVADARGYGRGRDESSTHATLNKKAWENYAAVKTAEKDGVLVSDRQLAQTLEGMFATQGGFDFNRYNALVRSELGLTPEGFEAYLRRQMTVREGIERTMLASAAWASPMEVDQLVADLTDSFTVRVASFKQEKADADAVKLDDAGLRKWYDANTKKIALPERVKIRYVRYDATDPKVLEKMVVTDNELHDQYDANVDKYTSTDTNGVEVVKKFEEVKDELDKELRQIAAVNFFETNLTRRAYANLTEADKGKSRLDTIAAQDGAKVETSNWFSIEGGYVEGFMVHPSGVLPGAQNLLEAVAELDPDVEDLRYAVVSSDRNVWLVEKAETSQAHTPSFEEAKDKIGGMALRDAKADAFKASVEAVAAKGLDALLARDGVTTNITFVASDLRRGEIADQSSVVRAATQLKKGELSEFTLVGPGRAILVYCVDRVPGDAAKIVMMRAQMRDQAASAHFGDIVSKWKEWNLARLGFTTTDETSVAEEAVEE